MKSKLRRLALSRQGLGPLPESSSMFGEGPTGAAHAVEHLGYVQIDTLAVIERAHHHILWTRVPGYEPAHLNRLLREGQVFEHWFHAASCLPMRDYRFSLPLMAEVRDGRCRHVAQAEADVMREVLARVRADGLLSIRQLDKAAPAVKDSWWNWDPAKRALNRLFMQGDLMVCGRLGMEKVYDLAERVRPAGLDLREPTPDEFARYLLDTVLRAHGVVTWAQLLHLRPGAAMKASMRRALDARLDDGSVVPLDWCVMPDAYMDAAAAEFIESTPARSDRVVRLLSPFDNAVIHRDRLSALFGLDYRLECYTPAAKRVYGYFCLPILFGDRFVGRVDCKAHRREQRFELLSVHVDEPLPDPDVFLPRLAEALQALAGFCGCRHVEVRPQAAVTWLPVLARLLAST